MEYLHITHNFLFEQTRLNNILNEETETGYSKEIETVLCLLKTHVERFVDIVN